MATAQDLLAQREIWRQTREEDLLGRVGPPRPLDPAIPRVLTTRFGVRQSTSRGTVKTQCIDNFKTSGIYDATAVCETIHHHHVDDLVYVCQQIHRAGR